MPCITPNPACLALPASALPIATAEQHLNEVATSTVFALIEKADEPGRHHVDDGSI